jgi:glutathione synthase/RimK-type ligase-like ATP-grasp enzyme
MRRYIYSKWAKTRAILANSNMRKYIPQTIFLKKNGLHQMLHTYKMVYIKPDIGTFGNGVMRVEWNEGAKTPYLYQNGVQIKRFTHFPSMFNSIRQEIKNRNYLVQKGIHLLRYKGNRFDLRVMVQQTPNLIWETTGIIGRVAHPQKIVTNFHNGGKIQPVETLLSAYLPENKKQAYIHKLALLGLGVAGAIHHKYPGVKEIGVDVAIDRRFQPWILEVNTSPDPYIFRRLKNKQVFNKIQRYSKAYNRL